jgi:hypothetical protein
MGFWDGIIRIFRGRIPDLAGTIITFPQWINPKSNQ